MGRFTAGYGEFDPYQTGPNSPGGPLDNQAKCDERLARIFGGPKTVMATKWDVGGLMPPLPGQTEPRRKPPYDREATVNPMPGGEDPRTGTVHLYSNADGTTDNNPNAYTPPGWADALAGVADTGNWIRFYYSPGSLAKYGYNGGLTVNFTHFGPTFKNGKPITPARNGPTNQNGSVQVGVLGGGLGTDPNLTKGSDNGYWVHSHMIFNTWNGRGRNISMTTRIDPRTVFCRDLGF